MTITIEDVRTAVHEMSAKLYDGRRYDLVGFTIRDGSYPWIEVHDGVIHWTLMERGVRYGPTTTEDLHEAMHWVALDATRSMAMRWELGQRDRWPEDRDTRIGWNAKQVALLRLLDDQWAEEYRADIPARCPGVRLEDVDAHPLAAWVAIKTADESFLARQWRTLRDKLREPY
ncbi:Imm63 family immunity protein [Streptomyces sp. MNP-20]|uniref:Imm63 family immunity protein n=1 Tax=Streptomyces sp. MNP-20 TaxID=2721165 RepID=UPI0015564317|nr:Imm63 family immunity protein [Streptomyces sp. MNP-20]